MVFITLFSLLSFPGVQTSSFTIPHMDKAVHFTFYFVMVLLAFFAKTDWIWKGFESLKLLWAIVLFAIGYGIIIEIIQDLSTVDRQGDPWDALANSIGAISGILFIRLLFLWKQSLK